MKSVYLVDFENVGSDGLAGLTALTAEDQVLIFYSANSNRLNIRTHILISSCPAAFSYFEASVGGKNALDHQLSSFLGYLIATNAAERYFIVSRDNGYRFAAQFWNGRLETQSVYCIDAIKSARAERRTEQTKPAATGAEAPAPQPQAPVEAFEAAGAPEAPVEDAAPDAEPEPAAEPEEPSDEATSKTLPFYVVPSEQVRRPQQAHRRPRGSKAGRAHAEVAHPKQLASEQAEPAPEPSAVPAPVEQKQEPKAPAAAEPVPAPRAETLAKPQAPVRAADAALKEKLQSILAPYPKLSPDRISDLIVERKKQILFNSLRKQLGQEKGLALYNELKKNAWK